MGAEGFQGDHRWLFQRHAPAGGGFHLHSGISLYKKSAAQSVLRFLLRYENYRKSFHFCDNFYSGWTPGSGFGLTILPRPEKMGYPRVGLWRSWERASMAWKRSSVRSRPGPPYFQLLADIPLFSLVAFGSTTLGPRVTSSKLGRSRSSALMASTVFCTLSGISCM